MEANDELIAKIVRLVAGRKIAMFAAFKDIGVEDLIQEATAAVIAAQGGYDARRGAFSTFVYTVASRTIIDVHRARVRTGERETRVVEMRPDCAMPTISDEELQEPEPDEERWGLPLKEFAAATYRKNIFTVPKKRAGRGPQFYSPIVAATIIDLKARTKASYRGLQDMIRDDVGLRSSLRLARFPNFMTIQRMCNKCRGRSANNRARRARINTEAMGMAKVLEVAELCNELEASKALNVHVSTLAQRRKANKLPEGLCRPNPITGLPEYSVKRIRELVQ